MYKRTHKDDEFVESAFYELQNSPLAFPIEGHYDWRKAIIRAAEKFKCFQISQVLPEAYEEYKLRMSSGLPFKRDEHTMECMKSARSQVLEQILGGRELKGEPRDLNF